MCLACEMESLWFAEALARARAGAGSPDGASLGAASSLPEGDKSGARAGEPESERAPSGFTAEIASPGSPRFVCEKTSPE